MLDLVKKLYRSSGFSSSHLLSSLPSSLLFGRKWNQFTRAVEYDASIVGSNLYGLLLYNKQNTNYGRDLLNSRVFYPDEVFDVYKELPIIRSDDLRDNLSFFLSKSSSRWNSYSATTGGTGKGITNLVLSNDSYTNEWAHILHMWSKTGFNRRLDSRISFRGVSNASSGITFNAIYNEYIVNSLFLNDEILHESVVFIKKNNIRFLHIYPSNLELLYQFCQHNNISLVFQGIFCGSEGVDVQRRLKYEKFFSAKLIHWYGLSERVSLGYDEFNNGSFKLFTSYGLLTIDNNLTGSGELLGSTFINESLPLIKYSTGDYGKVSLKNNCYYLSDIKGRWGKDFIYKNDGSRISSTQLNFHDEIFNALSHYQIHQSKYSEVDLYIVFNKDTSRSKNELMELLKRYVLKKLVGFTINVFEVDYSALTLNKRGKVKMIVQNLNIDEK
jgi:phenylacetate-CoA ligase